MFISRNSERQKCPKLAARDKKRRIFVAKKQQMCIGFLHQTQPAYGLEG
jgi:hypothetical protein